jgi:hypothetical protein
MNEKKLKYFFPYKLEKENDFRTHFKNRDEFLDKMWGKNEYYYKDEANYGVRRNRDNLSLIEQSKNDYIVDEFFNWERWYKAGRNIFSFSIELLEMLNHTDVNDINYKSFNLPYDNFYISLKPLGLKASIESDVIIEGVYVEIDRDTMSNEPEDGDVVADYAIHFHFVGDFEEFILKFHDKVWNYKGSGGESFWDYAFYFDETKHVITILDAITDWKDVYSYSLFPEKPIEVTDSYLDIFNLYQKFVDNTCMILVNCLLYLSMPPENRDVISSYAEDLPFNFNKKLRFAKNKGEISKIEKKISTTGYSKIQYVGNSYIKIQNNDNSSISKVLPHWRRGHWRNQRYGESLINTKLIWIKPVIVNNAIGKPEKGHIYEINK